MKFPEQLQDKIQVIEDKNVSNDTKLFLILELLYKDEISLGTSHKLLKHLGLLQEDRKTYLEKLSSVLD